LDWSIGFVVLVGLTAACAVFLWRSPSPAPAGATVSPSEAKESVPAAKPDSSPGRGRNPGRKHAHKVMPSAPPTPTPAPPPPPPAVEGDLDPEDGPHPLGSSGTPGRRLRWVLLAVVPSSLMLGATTYITTDIAAIPLLWVLPLALYLLSFIIVFAHIPARLQSIATLVALDLLMLAVIVKIAPIFLQNESLLWLV